MHSFLPQTRPSNLKSASRSISPVLKSLMNSSQTVVPSQTAHVVDMHGPTLQDHFQRRIQKQLDAIESIREDLTQEV